MHVSLSRHLYLGLQYLRGEPVSRVVHELELSERWSPERLAEQQWERQLRLAWHAYHTVPFYQDHWDAAGFHPRHLNHPDDWSRIPVLEKSDVQAHRHRMRSARASAGLMASTSGSSGTPLAVDRSHLSWAHAHANVFRGWRWHGLDIGDPYAYFWGRPLDDFKLPAVVLRDRLFNRRRMSPFDLHPGSALLFYQQLRSKPARFAFGYPSAISQFAREITELRLEGRALGWQVVITSAETLLPVQRAQIAETFGCPIVDSYGCAEAGVAGFECSHGVMHVPTESVVVESAPLEQGLSELLLTDLHNRRQPIIRYRVGDLVEPIHALSSAPSSRCRCGVNLPAMGTIIGRSGDMIDLGAGRQVNANLPSYIFKRYAKSGAIREYQFVQHEDGGVELYIAPGPSWERSMCGNLRLEVQRVLGIDVEVRTVDRCARSMRGKRRDFVRINRHDGSHPDRSEEGPRAAS